MSSGQRVLIFLYPRSRLGLTSPVGGSQGQIALDASGMNVSALELHFRNPIFPGTFPSASGVTVAQLERAIRRAREE